MAAEAELAGGDGADEQAAADGSAAPAGAQESIAPAGAEAEGGEAAPEPCYGRIKSYNYAKGFGFLESPPLSARFGRDVFLRKEAVLEEVLLGRIASGSGPKAAVQRGEIFVRFALTVNEAGHPEARDVREVKRAAVPQEILQELPPVQAKAAAPAAKAAGGREAKSAGGEGGEREAPEGSRKSSRAGGSGKEGEEPGKVGPYLCKVGKNAEENWDLLQAAKSKHWFFHLTDHPSAYVILECDKEPAEEEKLRCAQICRDKSKMKLSGAIKVDATLCGNVSFDRRRDVVGECSYKKEKLVEILTVS